MNLKVKAGILGAAAVVFSGCLYLYLSNHSAKRFKHMSPSFIADKKEAGQGTEDSSEMDWKDHPSSQKEEILTILQRRDEEQQTEEERDAGREEIARMQEKLIHNAILPPVAASPRDIENHQVLVQQILSLGNRISKGQATKEESIQFYTLKIGMVQDKIDLATYIIARARELEKETGDIYLPENGTESPENILNALEAERTGYQNKLDELAYD